jgi:hypothetical protein
MAGLAEKQDLPYLQVRKYSGHSWLHSGQIERRQLTVHVFRHIVAGTAILRAFVEGQEIGIFAGQPRCHLNLVLAHRKVHQRTALEAEQRFGLFCHRINWQARRLVLLDCTIHRLLELGFQFQRGNWQTIHKQHQIDTPGLGLATYFK